MSTEIVRLGFSKQERLRFLRAGMDVYAGDANFVPELQSDLLRRTDPGDNPFFAHAEVTHLVAHRDGRDVGRIAAIRNTRSEEARSDHSGWFGWFECENDAATAKALFDKAARCLGEHGCDAMLGPASYSTNDACGLLVEGFDGPPVLMMPYNPPWYADLLASAGCEPAEDLLAWDLHERTIDRKRFGRIVERSRKKHGWTLRPLRMDRFDEEIDRIRSVYNRAWEANWGFVPMTAEEFAWAAADMKPVIVPDLVLLAERGDETLGFSLSLPDLNVALQAAGGSLFPLGWWRAWRASRGVNRVRVLALGVVPEARRMGLDAGLYLETMKQAVAHGYPSGECSWTLARNHEINQGMEALGARLYRRYRLFQRPVP
ncbi:MAG: GNAT family N-acetyltransferase [Planctomycetota bacterium]|jgi:GNAT superfamily N-acetyltransferase